MIATSRLALPVDAARSAPGPIAPADVALGVGLALLTLAVRLIPAWWLDAIVHDVAVYFVMAQYVLRGDNIYAQRILFPYMPFSQFHPALALLLSQALKWPFDFAVKLPEIVTDAGCALLIYGYLRGSGARVRVAALWTLLWALNPVSILISAFHGNVMASVPFFVLGAYVAAERARTSPHRRHLLAVSALMLGIGIALRTYPVLMVPLFLVLGCRSVKEALAFGLIAAFPAAVTALPYLVFARATFLAEVLGYGGFTDFGWVSVLRTIPFLVGSGGRLSYFGGPLLEITRGIFTYGYALLMFAIPAFRPSSLGRSLALMPLMFYAFYGGVGAQYLVWVIPVAIATRDRAVIVHTLVATIALLGFYGWYAPSILVGRHAFPALDPKMLASIYAVGNVLLVAASAAWLVRILTAELRAFRAAGHATEFRLVERLMPLWAHRGYWIALIVVSAVVLGPRVWQSTSTAIQVMRASLPAQYHVFLPRL